MASRAELSLLHKWTVFYHEWTSDYHLRTFVFERAFYPQYAILFPQDPVDFSMTQTFRVHASLSTSRPFILHALAHESFYVTSGTFHIVCGHFHVRAGGPFPIL